MKELITLLAYFIIVTGAAQCAVPTYEGSRSNSIALNGIWDFAKGTGSERAETPAGQQQLKWQSVSLPGLFRPYKEANQMKIAWARRNFTVTTAQAKGFAVLRWNRIACGAEAFINGQKVGENEPTGPYQVIVQPGVIKSGVKAHRMWRRQCGLVALRTSPKKV